MKKSGSRTPRIELEDMGPSVDFVMRRTKLASDDLYKRSLKIPKNATVSAFSMDDIFLELFLGAQWLSGRVLDSRPRGCGFEPHCIQYYMSVHLSLLVVTSLK